MKKLLILFTFSAMTGILILGFLFFADYTTGPDLMLHNVTIELTEKASAWDFVTECSEKNASVHFISEPDFSVPGGQEVEIEAVDANGRTTRKKAMLRITILKRNLRLEADGNEMTVKEVLVDEIAPEEVTFKYKAVKKDHVGMVELVAIYQGVEYAGEVELIDETAPEIMLKEKIIVWQGHTFDALTAAASIGDATEVTATWQGILDTETEGEYPLLLLFTDAGGNETQVAATVFVIKDTQPPVIYGAENREFKPGDAISYLENVWAEDAVDGSCDVYVDNSQVQTDVEGSYPLVYRAKDASGNETTAEVTFTIRNPSADEEKMNRKADEVLAELTDETMSQAEIAYAIYNYAYAGIEYTGTSDKSDWIAEAYRGMSEKKGDCFTYASVCKALLRRAGIRTMDVTRIGGEAEHYWLLVDVGNGWYHFDATRRKEYFDGFMARDEDLERYTAKVGQSYYTFDHSSYPATPTEKFQMED